MRVGIFTESFEPVQNGVSTSVRTLIDELRANRHHVFVVAPSFPDYQEESPFVMRVPSMVFPFQPDFPIAYPFFPKLNREYKRIEPDVLHSHNPFFIGFLAARLSRKHGLPLVSTYHTLYNHYGHYFFLPDVTVNSLLEWWIPEYYNRCHCVITPSGVAKESLVNYGVTSEVYVIPTAVELPDPALISKGEQQRVRTRWGIPADKPFLLTLGRVAKEKNIELSMLAFERVAGEFPDLQLVIAGAGAHEDECKAFAETLTYGERILFTGAIPHHECYAMLAAAELFVFGSSTETQGLVIAEARSVGTPCVVVNEGGAHETVRHGIDGFVVEPTVSAFAAAVQELLSKNDLRASMREACLQSAPNYTPLAMAGRVLEVYERAIERARSTPETIPSR